MRSDILRIYKSVHTWAGILAGLALFIAFYAGALTVFKEPIARWLAPPDGGLPGVRAVTLADTPALMAATLAARPETARDLRLDLRPAGQPGGRLSWTHSERAAGPPGEEGEAGPRRQYTASFDAQGGLQVSGAERSTLPVFIDTLHRVVGLPVDNDANRLVMGVVAALYAVALVSGVIVLLPTLVKDFFALRVGRNLKRMWLDAHNVIGIVSLPFHIVMALSAAVFAFHDDIYLLQNRVIYQGGLQNIWRGQPASGGAPAKTPVRAPTPSRDPADMLPPAELLARVHRLSPGFEPTVMQYSDSLGPRASVRVWGGDPQGMRRSARGGYVSLDPYTGKVTSSDYLPGRQTPALALLTSFFALHFGTFGGTAVSWAYFMLGLAGAFLFYTGNLLWVESRRKQERRGQPTPLQKRNTAWLAALTVGVSLGCICGISATLAAGKLLHGHVSAMGAWHVGIYYLAFFGCIAWSFWRGAAHAGGQLLRTCAVVTALVPAASLAGFLAPAATGLWAPSGLPALGVDLTAAVMSLGFFWMSRAATRRSQGEPTASVWSVRVQ